RSRAASRIRRRSPRSTRRSRSSRPPRSSSRSSAERSRRCSPREGRNGMNLVDRAAVRDVERVPSPRDSAIAPPRPRPPRAFVATLLLLLLVLAGCSARRIREAQDHFNRAAESERVLEAAPASGADAMRASASAASDYALALSFLDGEIAGHAADLK